MTAKPTPKIVFATRRPVGTASAPAPVVDAALATAALAEVPAQDPDELPIRFPPEMRIHPFARIYPAMTRRRFKEWLSGVRAAGEIIHAILRLPDGSTVDGRHREYASILLGLPLKVEVWTGEVDETLLMRLRQDNAERRDLTRIQRAECADREAEALAQVGRARQLAGLRRGAEPGVAAAGGRLLEARSAANGVSMDTAKRLRWARRREPAVRELVSEGRLTSVADAERLARLPEGTRPAAVQALREGKRTKDVLDLLDAPQAAPVDPQDAQTERLLDAMLTGRQALRPVLRRLLQERPPWADLNGTEKNHVRALALKGLAAYDVKGTCEALVPPHLAGRGPVGVDSTPTGAGSASGPVEVDSTPTGAGSAMTGAVGVDSTPTGAEPEPAPGCAIPGCTEPVAVERPHLMRRGKASWCALHDPAGGVRTVLAQMRVNARGALARLAEDKRAAAAQELAEGLRVLAQELVG